MSQSSSSKTIVDFCALSGADNENALCYILSIKESEKEYNILLDCGWAEEFNREDQHIQELAKWAPKIHIILLSHPSIHHVGAIPYLMKRMGCTAKIYGTMPTIKLAKLQLLDTLQAIRRERLQFNLFGAKDVSDIFDNAVELQYSQTVDIDPNDKPISTDISIVPYPAGYSYGGSIWKIKYGVEDIVYAVDMNNVKEKVAKNCDETVLEKIRKPSLLITNSYNYNQMSQFDRKKFEEQLLDSIKSTLGRAGSVLMPVDVGGRFLEIMSVLENFWREMQLPYKLIFLFPQSEHIREYIKSSQDWFSSETTMKDNHNIYFLKERKDLDSIKDKEGMLIVTASSSMDVGFGKDLFSLYVSEYDNNIIVTDRGRKGSFLRGLLEQRPDRVSIDIHQQVALTEEEKKKVEQEMARENEQRLENEQLARVLNKSKNLDDDQMEDDPYYLFLPPGQTTEQSVFLVYPYKDVDERDPLDPNLRFGIEVDSESMRDRRNLLYQHDNDMEDTVNEKQEVEEDFFMTLDREYEDFHRQFRFQQRNFELDVNCTIRYIDFSGRSGRVATKEMLKKIRPHNMIIVNGPKHFSEFMQNDIHDHCSNINVPSQMDTISVELQSTFYEIKLNNALYNASEREICTMKNQFKLRYVDGVYGLGVKPTLDDEQEDDHMEDDLVQETPVLADVRSTTTTETDQFEIRPTESKWHDPIFVTDNRFVLSTFKSFLENLYEDMATEYERVDGFNALVCNGKVFVKVQNERVTVEGNYCDDYFRIRDALYKFLQVL